LTQKKHPFKIQNYIKVVAKSQPFRKKRPYLNRKTRLIGEAALTTAPPDVAVSGTLFSAGGRLIS